MIAHDDAIAAHLDSFQGIFSRHDTFDPDLHVSHASQPRNLPRPVVRVVVERHETVVVRLIADALAIPAKDRTILCQPTIVDEDLSYPLGALTSQYHLVFESHCAIHCSELREQASQPSRR